MQRYRGSAAADVSRQTVSNCVVFCFLYVRRSELWGHRRSNFGNKITVYRRSLRSSRWKRNRLPRFPSSLSCLRSYPRRLLETNCLFSSIMARIFLSVLRRYVACPREQKDDNFHEILFSSTFSNARAKELGAHPFVSAS